MNKKNLDIFKNLIFLDTETTGLEKEDRLFQIAYIYNQEKFNKLFNPERKISIEASETTGYTNKDTDSKEVFLNSKDFKKIETLLEDQENIFIAHNAKFDIEMLSRESLKVHKFIDTYKVAQTLDKDCFFKAYRLQYLRYAMNFNIKNAQAHDAMGDVIVLKELFKRLYLKIQKKIKNHKDILEYMIDISKKPLLIKKINFGKYKGQFLEKISEEDKGYLEWLLREKEKQQEEESSDNTDWIYTLKYYLK